MGASRFLLRRPAEEFERPLGLLVNTLILEDRSGLAGQRFDLGRMPEGGMDLGELQGDQGGVEGVFG